MSEPPSRPPTTVPGMSGKTSPASTAPSTVPSTSASTPISARTGKPKLNWKNGPPSCKECVRLKLKCSRQWPCTSCVRRGCEKICPTGTLAGRPTRDQATIQRLQKENDELKARIAGLEGQGGDRGAYASSGPPTHDDDRHYRDYTPFSAIPASPPEVEPLPEDNRLDAATGAGSGLLEANNKGSKYLGRGAGSMFVCEDDESTLPTLHFPFLASEKGVLATLHELFPSAEDAYALLRVYDEQVEWMYHPVDREAVAQVLTSIYSGDASVRDKIRHVPPHRLASVLMVLALGVAFSGRPMTQSIPLFNGASALICIPDRHFMVRHSLPAVETLHMMVSYLLGLQHSDGPKAAWEILGLCVRTACSIGLHRDSSEWGLNPEQQRHRQHLWWECVTYDILQALNFGRPYSTPAQLYDCPLPPMPPDGGVTPHDDVFHIYLYKLGQRFVHVADYLASPVLPDYSEVVKIDSDLRRVEATAPTWLKWADVGDMADNTSGLLQKNMLQQHSATMFFNKGLLMLHRPSFFKAVESGSEPLLGPYAASFTTCVTSARKHTRLVASLLRRCPPAAYGWWYWIFHAYTAAVIQYTVLRRAPTCMMAPDVRADFKVSHDIIAQMAEHSGVARRALPMLERLRDRLNNPLPKVVEVDTPLSAFLGTDSSSMPSSVGHEMTYSGWVADAAVGEASASAGAGSFGSSGVPPDSKSNGLVNANAYGMGPVNSASAMDTGLMLGFEQPTFMNNQPDQLSITDPLIQTLLYWNVIANPDGPNACPVPQL